MSDTFLFYSGLIDLLPEIPPDSIVSRSIYEADHLKAVLFGFAAGQELSEHTASSAAILHFIEGEAELTLGTENQVAQAGTWIHMAANLPHSVKARTRLVMLLLLLR
jgi:quercetin dioxygenase-like cupin family protein